MAKYKTVDVTVVGGGIAGITSALRLAERGYAVTLYDQNHVLGGNLGAYREGWHDEWHDVYPHMFSTFYHNFWQIVEKDLGWVREQHFQPRECVKIIRKDGKYITMTDGTSIRNAWQNLWHGIVPPADMLVWAYSMLDLMSTPLDRDFLLDEYSVNGFVGSKPYGTNRAASLHDFILMVVWSAHSYGVPARAYKDFFRFTLRNPSPLTWALRGTLHDALMAPLTKKLEALGVTVRLGHRVERILVNEHALIDEIWVRKLETQDTTQWTQSDLADWTEPDYKCLKKRGCEKVQVENLVLAVNPQAAGLLAQVGKTGTRLVDRIPALSETRRAVAEPIAVLRTYFKVKVPDIPSEHVSLWDSDINLNFLDISQLWPDLEKEGKTVLTVAASNYYGLPGEALRPGGEGAARDAEVMLRALMSVLPQIEHDDIDWDRNELQRVEGNRLFKNTVDSETWRPEAHDEALPNLFMAGGYCYNPVGMATVEGAVTTGLQAARALHSRTPLGPPVEIIEHEAYPAPVINAMKLAMMPLAYQAKWWSAMTDVARDAAESPRPAGWGQDLASLWSLPAYFAADLWKTSSTMYDSAWAYLSGRR